MRRSFIPGSEWLYYKIYTGSKTADRILAEAILPLSQQLQQDQLIDQWFYIRYGDPENHLRVRFHLPDTAVLGAVMNSITPVLEEFHQLQLTWKVQLDVYNRELERYGTQNIVRSEQLFYHESDMLAQFLSLIDGDEGEEIRWLFGLRAIDQFLDDFGMSIDQKIDLLQTLKAGFMQEFGIEKPTKRQLDNKFRQERANIDWFLQFTRADQPDYAPLLDLLDEKSQRSKPIIKEIRQEVPAARLPDLLGSYIHMMMNRLFRSKNRMHELVMYYLLWRTLETGKKRAMAGSLDVRR